MKALLLAAALAGRSPAVPALAGAIGASGPGLAEAAGSSSAPELKVLSFNAAGVPIVHAKIGARMKAIGRRLAEGGWDVIALQEVWRDSDAARLADAAGLPHRARAKQAWLVGDGLMILSRYPILEQRSIAFADRTRRALRLDGEQLAHKGALLARIEAPGGPVDVYDVHFVADYKKYANPEVRHSQAGQLAAWVRETSAGRPAVLAGDLNMVAADPDFRLLTAGLGFVDGCSLARDNGCGASRGDKRIDHVFLSAGSPAPPGAGVALGEALRVSGKEYPLSDHLGIFVRAALPLAPLPRQAPAAVLAER